MSRKMVVWVGWKGRGSAMVAVALLGFVALPGIASAGEISFSEPATLGEDSFETNLWKKGLSTDGVGNWVTVWTSDDSLGETIGTDRDILVTVSSDNGDSWSQTTALHGSAGDDDGDDDNPSVAFGRQVFDDEVYVGATCIVVWESTSDLGLGLREDPDILFSRRPAGLSVWSFPAPVNANAVNPVSKNGKFYSYPSDDEGPHVASDGQHTWLVTWWRYGAPQALMAAVSDDDGQSWKTETVISDLPYEKPESAIYANGRWGILSAPTAYEEGIHVYTSSNGVVWTESIVAAQNPYKACIAASGSDWMIMWEMLDGPFPEYRVFYSVSDDSGDTWTEPQRLTHADNLFTREHQPTLATDNVGSWLAIIAALNDNDIVIGEEGDLVAYRSDDFGSTWTEPILVASDALEDATVEYLPVLRVGALERWVAAWNTMTNEEPQIYGNRLAIADFPTPAGTPGISISPRYTFLTSEDGNLASFNVALDAQPTDSVEIPINSTTISEGLAVPVSLTFGTENWDLPQEVSLVGIDDNEVDGDQPYAIKIGPAISMDTLYSGLSAPPVFAVNEDNDAATGVHIGTIDYVLIRRDLEVTVSVVDDFSAPVAGAHVEGVLKLGGATVASISGDTDAEGLVSTTYRKAPDGMYATTVISITFDALTWDGETPENTFTKP